ncbi:MAG TPA: chorismate mutase [Candidatus Paceibacterota bacterium]|jgi:chorismate mutase|nr:chorismate mutase [Candidatus Paceibacterota bacterium]
MTTPSTEEEAAMALIAEKRKLIDDGDAIMAQRICVRHQLVLEIGVIKKKYNIAVHDPEREANQMAALCAVANEHKTPLSILLFPFKLIILMSRRSQGEQNKSRIINKICWNCGIKTPGVEDEAGGGFRICLGCRAPLF